jgi:hypothetical protein
MEHQNNEGLQIQTLEERFRENTKDYVDKLCVYVDYSQTRLRQMTDELDFVYIDGNHCFDFVMQDLIEWNKKVRKGGVISGHDYYRFKGAGVVNAVDAYTVAHQIHEWFLDDQRETSFFWAKP